MKKLALVGGLSVLVISLAVSLPSLQAEACSRIFWNSNGQAMLTGRNMDLRQDDQPAYYVFPAGITKNGQTQDSNPAIWTSQYGSLVMAEFPQTYQSNFCSEGINTQGLAFHFLVMNPSQYETRNLTRPGVSGGIYGQYLLDNAANVEEALNLTYQTQVVPLGLLATQLPCHMALEDALGNSAVVEFVGGQMNVYQGPETYVLTNYPPLPQQLANLQNYNNFGGTLPLPGGVDAMSRFVRATLFLTTLDNPPLAGLNPDLISRLFSAIRAEAAPFGSMEYDSTGRSIGPKGPTLWTSLFDLTNKKVYFTHHIVRNNFWIDMSKLNFQAGAPVKSLNAENPNLSGEVSGLFASPAAVGALMLMLSD